MNQLVPIGNSPNQTLSTSLNIDGVVSNYQMTLRYNEVAGYWVMTVQDAAGNLILDSIPLITGNAPAGNILGQFAYLGIGSAYILNAGGVPLPDYPNNIDLGSDFFLIWGDTPTDAGTVLEEVSEGFGIADIHVTSRPHPPGAPNQFAINITMGGVNDIVTGDVVNLSGLTGAPWLNGASLSILAVAGLVITMIFVDSLGVGSIYGPAAETGVVTII